jgi:hypothetical protein
MPKIKTYPADEGCAGCGISHKTAQEDNHLDAGELLQELECPACGRMGCNVCMPGGVGCVCPECEEGGG